MLEEKKSGAEKNGGRLLLGDVDRCKMVDSEKGVVVGVCGLWSSAEPSQNRGKRARSQISK